MRWSKLKKTAESFLADTLKGRVQYYQTRYGRGVSTIQVRAWITCDKKEITNFSTVQWWWKYRKAARQIRTATPCDKDQADLQAKHQLAEKGCYPCDHFTAALREYITLSIDAALQSDNSLILALAMFDRRFGKRRLVQLRENPPKHPLVNKFFRLRCEAENILIDDDSAR